jgi:hypothetical protein
MIITFDLLNEIQHSLVRWKALANALLLKSPTPNSATQPESEITKLLQRVDQNGDPKLHEQ